MSHFLDTDTAVCVSAIDRPLDAIDKTLRVARDIFLLKLVEYLSLSYLYTLETHCLMLMRILKVDGLGILVFETGVPDDRGTIS